jgi:hypothetical protein
MCFLILTLLSYESRSSPISICPQHSQDLYPFYGPTEEVPCRLIVIGPFLCITCILSPCFVNRYVELS